MRLKLPGWLLPCLMVLPSFADAPPPFPAELKTKIDAVAGEVLAAKGVPGASVAVVKDGRIAYMNAYGSARIEPRTPAVPAMRFSIGSISKQFTAAAILMLAEDGKLGLDDRISRYLPDLTRADGITIRQILSHTSGYQDYWPQDYLMPAMRAATTAGRIMDTWARKPLDYEPGTQWQYSNTGYVIAGAIVEKVSGTPLFTFLQARVFRPLGMTSAWDSDQGKLLEPDAVGYSRRALGPLRPASKEGPGWMFAAGELAMTAEDLARWDLSVIRQSLLKPESYREMETEVRLANGAGTRYGLGIGVRMENGRRVLAHGGEVMGFTADNAIYPDDGIAVVVLTNQDAVSACDAIGGKIAAALFDVQDPAIPRRLERARQVLAGLQHGLLDRALFSDNCNSYFDEATRADYAGSLAGLGEPTRVVQTRQSLRGGMTVRRFEATFPSRKLSISTYELPDGRYEQFLVEPEE